MIKKLVNRDERVKSQKRFLHSTEKHEVIIFPPQMSGLCATPTIVTRPGGTKAPCSSI
jgi:hypothetical protein